MQNFINEIESQKKTLISNLSDCGTLNDVKNIKNKFLGKFLKSLYANLKNITHPEEKKEFGKIINNFKIFAQKKIDETQQKFVSKKNVYKYDPTVFKENIRIGKVHPLIKLYKKIENIFIGMGFSVVSGPEIELDKYNFEMLNLPKHHPARDMQDTFYISAPNILLRSHTSGVQVREMLKHEPPIQIISPGTVYRVDNIDPQHTPEFWQIEGLMVAEKISFANLKAILIKFLKEIFGQDTCIRFRPTYYPYTEPSAAIDMGCTKCSGNGCRVCKNSGWITVLGAGMVHPVVLEGVGIDSEKYTGFAFGLGLNRLAIIYYNLGEIRKIYENDISLWRQL